MAYQRQGIIVYRIAIVVYGWNRNGVFLPYKLDGKIRVEAYDLFISLLS